MNPDCYVKECTSYENIQTSNSFAIMSTSAALILTAANSFSLEKKNNHKLASIQVKDNATWIAIYTQMPKKGQRKITLLVSKDENRLLLT